MVLIIMILKKSYNQSSILTARTTQFINGIINESANIANVFSSYFESVTESLDLFNCAPEPYNQAKGSVRRIIQKFSHHFSIVKMKQNFKILTNFSFTQLKIETLKKSTNELSKNKIDEWLYSSKYFEK